MEAIDERVQEAGVLPAGGAAAGPGRPMTPVDLERITPAMARYLWSARMPIRGTIYSLRPEINDEIAGKERSFERACTGFMNLLDAGYIKNCDAARKGLEEPLLGLDIVILKPTMDDADALWHYCRGLGARPCIVPAGGVTSLKPELKAHPLDVQEKVNHLLLVDRIMYGKGKV